MPPFLRLSEAGGYILLFSFKINNLYSALGCVEKALRAARNAKSTHTTQQAKKKGANQKVNNEFSKQTQRRKATGSQTKTVMQNPQMSPLTAEKAARHPITSHV